MLRKHLRFRVGLLLSPPLAVAARRRGVYYGWPMLVGLSLAETVSWGILYYAFSVFVLPMERELGWSRSQVTGAFSLALLVSGLAAVPVGHWLDAHGARGLMTAGSAAGALLVLAWSRVDSLAGLYLVWAGLGVAMAAVLYEPAFAVVTCWFVRHRDRAFTVLTVFGGLASTIFVPLASWLLERRGWRGAIAVLAAILACTTLPLHGLVLRRRPRDLGCEADGETTGPLGEAEQRPERSIALRAALGSGTFWGLTVAIVASSLASVAAAVHLIPYLIECHVPVGTAGAAVGLFTTGARAAGPIAAALAYTALGQYRPVFLGLAALLVVAAAISALSAVWGAS